MQVKHLVHNDAFTGADIIKHHCSQFIQESAGHPIVKTLPQQYKDFQKVKVRKRKRVNDFSHTFNNAFVDEMQGLRERSVFVSGRIPVEENHSTFYVFPINGYKFLYSREVGNSSDSYQQVFESIFDVWDEDSAKNVVNDLLRFTYVSEDLSAGIVSGAEIILYNTPYYFAIRESYVESYDSLLTVLI